MIHLSLLLLVGLAAPAPDPGKPNPKAVSISNAGGGGLRDWQEDPTDPNSVYVSDRTLHWYHVRLTGDCPRLRTYGAMGYTTDVTGRFDTFSMVTFGTPVVRCGVLDIQRSAPPASIRRPKR